ncbi:Uncharacterized protein Rs2_29351 [Raphanus sativus]|uniref:Uncharacterized protein LOC108811221 n=1 Tax=Raphanus sativus TaxID=3726 RepID=A0A6J0JSV4_RAPSA|nr:uncharacterized protein LOC108811221 [Raphanus sativus]KAJ4889603.1 Uncharacterized protein Rs2_29351 [Raphanus sativus]
MSHSLSPLLPAAHAGSISSPSPPSSRPQTPPIILPVPQTNRRAIVVGLGSVLWSWNALNGKEEAMAAARRPPPPPAVEKKDPNVSGVQAKVLASKKRKEAMKASMSKLRERGKSVVDEEKPSSSSPSSPVVVKDEPTPPSAAPVVVKDEPTPSAAPVAVEAEQPLSSASDQ